MKKDGARGGNATAEADLSTAIGGDAGASGPEPGGRGGDARATKPAVTVVGGKGGRGGAVEGMPGMDVTDHGFGDGTIGGRIEGGMGGEAPQLDGRGGRGGLTPGSAMLDLLSGRPTRPHMKRPYWDDGQVEYGRGGDGQDSLQYRARRLIVEMIKAEFLGASSHFTTEVWYDRSVSVDVINESLARRGMDWRVSIEDNEYTMNKCTA